jgi:hypothetical protein
MIVIGIWLIPYMIDRAAYSGGGDDEGRIVSMQEFRFSYDVLIHDSWDNLNVTVYKDNDIDVYAKLTVVDGDDILYVYFLLKEDYKFHGYDNYSVLTETATAGKIEYKYLIDEVSRYALATFKLQGYSYFLNLDSGNPQRITEIINKIK